MSMGRQSMTKMSKPRDYRWRSRQRSLEEERAREIEDERIRFVAKVMAYRTSRLYKALDKHDSDTPQTIKRLLGEGEEAQMVDTATGRGYIHKIVEMFEAPQEDEFLESQCIPSMTMLATAGASVNLRDTDGNTPLHLAIILNSGAMIVNMLMKLGADVTILNDRKQKVGDLVRPGNTDPLMVKTLGLLVPGLWQAVESEDHEKVIDMLDKGCKIDCSVDGMSLIDRAKQTGNEKIISALQNYWPTNQFIYALYSEDTKKMKKILKKEKINVDMKDPSYVDDDGSKLQMTLLGTCLLLNLFESADFLVEKGANINERIPIGTNEADAEPLFFFLMKNHPSLMFSGVFCNILADANMVLIKRYSVGVLYTGFTNAWPVDIVERILDRGLDVTHRSEEGYTLRDNIFVQVAFYPRKKRLEKLAYVDQHIIRHASEGNLERLKKLAANGYMSLNIHDRKGKNAAYLAKKGGHKEVSEWLEGIGEVFKNVHSISEYVKKGNLGRAKEYMDDVSAVTKDRAGRTPLHLAVLFERRFVVRYLLKTYPASVHCKDDFGRTAMHYACAINEGQDMEEILVQFGADETTQDDLGNCPMDYKLNDDNFIEVEKEKTCGFDVYLLEVYISFADGIIEDDFDQVRDTRDDLYEEVKMSEIIPKMRKTTNVDPPGFLQMCLDHRRENIARYLINNGVDMWANVEYENAMMKFPVAVEKAKLTRLNEFLAKKRNEDENEDEKFRAAEQTIKSSTAWNNADDGSNDSDMEKSKSCTIL